MAKRVFYNGYTLIKIF